MMRLGEPAVYHRHGMAWTTLVVVSQEWFVVHLWWIVQSIILRIFGCLFEELMSPSQGPSLASSSLPDEMNSRWSRNLMFLEFVFFVLQRKPPRWFLWSIIADFSSTNYESRMTNEHFCLDACSANLPRWPACALLHPRRDDHDGGQSNHRALSPKLTIQHRNKELG
jgi:hypothetical protein